MKAVYFIRVLVISGELLIVLVGVLASNYLALELQHIASTLKLNEEFLKYAMMLPLALVPWVFIEVKSLLQEDAASVRLLTLWPDYWKLKIHAWVSLLYAITFAVLSLLPWIDKTGIGDGQGLLLFLVSITGQLWLAFTLYLAKIRAKEITAHFVAK